LGSSAPKAPRVGYLAVEVERSGRAATLLLKGELDLGSGHLVSEALLPLEGEPADPLVVDMSEVSFLDCSGLSVLLGAYSRALRDDRKLSIVKVQPAVRKVFSLTGCRELLSDADATDPGRETLKA
jgi:anti-sigma B factor antagonist